MSPLLFCILNWYPDGIRVSVSSFVWGSWAVLQVLKATGDRGEVSGQSTRVGDEAGDACNFSHR